MECFDGVNLGLPKKYGDEALRVATDFIRQSGIKTGAFFKDKAGVTGSSLGDIEKVLHVWQDPLILGPKPKFKIEGNVLTMIRESPAQCPAIKMAEQMNIPLEMVCNTVAFPMFRGVVEAVNPKAKHTSLRISKERLCG